MSINLHRLDDRGNFLCERQTLLDCGGPRHRHSNGRVGVAVGHSKIDPLRLYIGNDDGLGSSCLADGCAEQPHGPGAEDQNRRVLYEVGTVSGVHGHR